MTTPAVAVHQVRDGARVLRFRAAVIGAATSARHNSARWSELTVYRLDDGTYLISKVGRSSVAHAPWCARVNRRMVPWHKAVEIGEHLQPRVPCEDCRPEVDPIKDDVLLECTRYKAIIAPNAEHAIQTLTEGRPQLQLPLLVREVLAQCGQADASFSRYSEALGAPNAPRLNSTVTP
jgi:hypothetical protein